MAPTGEALKHFIFIMPEGAVAEEEKKESESLVDAPITPTMKVPEQRDGVGKMEKNHCRRTVMGPCIHALQEPTAHPWTDSAEQTPFGGRVEALVQSEKRFHGQNRAQQRRARRM